MVFAFMAIPVNVSIKRGATIDTFAGIESWCRKHRARLIHCTACANDDRRIALIL
jgi:hypothetical protein